MLLSCRWIAIGLLLPVECKPRLSPFLKLLIASSKFYGLCLPFNRGVEVACFGRGCGKRIDSLAGTPPLPAETFASMRRQFNRAPTIANLVVGTCGEKPGQVARDNIPQFTRRRANSKSVLEIRSGASEFCAAHPFLSVIDKSYYIGTSGHVRLASFSFASITFSDNEIGKAIFVGKDGYFRSRQG